MLVNSCSGGTLKLMSCSYNVSKQISTLAGNQVPSYFFPEVVFTMGIIGLGLLLFALLIGNMQNFLQSLGKRLENKPIITSSMYIIRYFET